jgi:acetyl esterase
MALGGDSAGGNLAAVVCRRLRDAGGPAVAFQALIYPATDMTASMPSHEHLRADVGLTRELMAWFGRAYLPRGADKRHPDASPLFAEDLSRLPPALVLTAGYDPLVDEGMAYAERLSAAGVPVRHLCQEGQVHGFFSMAGLMPEAAVRAYREIGAALRDALAA